MSRSIAVTKDSFDAALLPGVRDRLAQAYRSLRQSEKDVFRSVLNEKGVFREGVVHVRDCPLCDAPSLNGTLVYHAHGMHIVRCTRCDFVYSREVINREADESRYRGSNVMTAHMALHTNNTYAELEFNKARYVIGRLARAGCLHEASMLDIGCSTGALLQAAHEVGWQALGIELNHSGVEIARKRGLTVVEGCFPHDLPLENTSFDAITMLDVLEHAEDPTGFLASVVDHLSERGVLGIQVPNFNSLLIQIEGSNNNNICHGHWSYFTPDTLAKVAKKVGLETLLMETIISEIDRIRSYPESQVCEVARHLTGADTRGNDIDHTWVHEHLLGYKIFGVFRVV